MNPQETTIVYLIHFSEPYHHARHYIGSTFDLDVRMQQHEAGQGARLLEVVTNAGIDWDVVRTWNGDRKLERLLKDRHNAALLCPECSGEEAYNRGNFDQPQTLEQTTDSKPARSRRLELSR